MMRFVRRGGVGIVLMVIGFFIAAPAPGQTLAGGCTQASDACWHSLTLTRAGASGALHYYASLTPAQDGQNVTAAVIAVHGYSHDASTTFEATAQAAETAGVLARTLIVAPLFQVPQAEMLAKKPCMTRDVPGPVAGDVTWSCDAWSDGGRSLSGGPNWSAFEAADRLVAQLVSDFPGIRVVTLAGFSAGGQMVQRYAAVAAPALAASVRLRFVVSDPGSWVYFDPVRPYPTLAGAAVAWSRCDPAAGDGLGGCALHMLSPQSLPNGWTPPGRCNQDWPAQYNRWKYGTDALPWRGPDGATMRAAYRAADISYLLARDDWGDGRGTARRVLDTTCGAELQGPYRLQRGLGYAVYDRSVLAGPTPHTVTIVPGCKHAVGCVFRTAEARRVLFPN